MLQGLVGGIAFADAAQVQAHVRDEQGHRARARVQAQLLPAHRGPGLGDLGGRGEDFALPGKAP